MSARRVHIALVFRRELLDLRRERRVMRRLVLQPLVFLLLLAAPAAFIQRADARDRATTFTVAVEGDVDAIEGLRDALDRAPFRVVPTDAAAESIVGERAEIGVVLPPDAAARAGRSDTVEVEVLTFSTQDVSERAGPALVQRLAEVARSTSRTRVVEAGAPSDLASPLRIVTEDVATTSAEGVRFGVAQGLPALLVIQLFGLMSLAQERIAGAKDKRVLEPTLVLPARRVDLLLGIGGATMAVGAVSAVVIFVPLTLGLSGLVAAVSRSLAGPGAIVLALVLGAGCLAVTFTSVGLFLGARAASGSEGSVFVTVVQTAVFAAIVILPFLTEIDASGGLLSIPIVGPMLFVRDGIAAGSGVGDIAAIVAGHIALTMLILGRAARTLDGERNVLRLGGQSA